jgi:uncharacterized protein
MKLSEINIYPFKSLKGIALKESKVEERGLAFDRRWMLVDENNRFLTQREHPRMALLTVEIGADGITVSAPNASPISIPADAGADSETVKVWSSSVKAAVHSGAVNRWFSDVLGMPCKLAAMASWSKRIVNPVFAVRRFRDEVSFADGYPFLLIGEGSLADLNSRLSEPVPMNRFRPNLVATGAEPFAEDAWKRIRIGETEFHVVKPCARCVMTTIDQARGERAGNEPLATLAKYRSVNGSVMFGQNLIAESAGGTVRVGDAIEVLEFKDQRARP